MPDISPAYLCTHPQTCPGISLHSEKKWFRTWKYWLIYVRQTSMHTHTHTHTHTHKWSMISWFIPTQISRKKASIQDSTSQWLKTYWRTYFRASGSEMAGGGWGSKCQNVKECGCVTQTWRNWHTQCDVQLWLTVMACQCGLQQLQCWCWHNIVRPWGQWWCWQHTVWLWTATMMVLTWNCVTL